MSRIAILAIALVASCRPLPPAPMTPTFASTQAEPKGAITGMLVLGIASEGILGGAGFGSALRVQVQASESTAVGGEFSAGKIDPGELASGKFNESPAHRGMADVTWFLGLRAYGRSSFASSDWIAVDYGVGTTLLGDGTIALMPHAGVASSYPNRYAVPQFALGLAPSLIVRRGDLPTGIPHGLFLLSDVALVVPFSDTGHRMALAVAMAYKVSGRTGGIFGVAIADAHTFE